MLYETKSVRIFLQVAYYFFSLRKNFVKKSILKTNKRYELIKKKVAYYLAATETGPSPRKSATDNETGGLFNWKDSLCVLKAQRATLYAIFPVPAMWNRTMCQLCEIVARKIAEVVWLYLCIIARNNSKVWHTNCSSCMQSYEQCFTVCQVLHNQQSKVA